MAAGLPGALVSRGLERQKKKTSALVPRSSPFCRQLRERSEKNPSGCDRPEERADVGGQEELPAAALGRSDYPVLPESSGGSEEVSPGKTQAAATAAAAASQRGRALQKGTLGFGTALSDAAGAEGRGRPEVGEGLAGEAALPAGLGSRRCAAVLRTVLEGQESAEESENGGSLRAAPPEAQCRHGEQDHAAAAQDKRAGTTRFSHPARLDDTAGHWELSCHMHGMCVCVHPPPAASGNGRAQSAAVLGGGAAGFREGGERQEEASVGAGGPRAGGEDWRCVGGALPPSAGAGRQPEGQGGAGGADEGRQGGNPAGTSRDRPFNWK